MLVVEGAMVVVFSVVVVVTGFWEVVVGTAVVVKLRWPERISST